MPRCIKTLRQQPSAILEKIASLPLPYNLDLELPADISAVIAKTDRATTVLRSRPRGLRALSDALLESAPTLHQNTGRVS